MSTDEIITALRRHYSAPEWVFFDELRLGVGYQTDSEKRVDGWAIHCYQRPVHPKQPNGNTIVALEVKISRSDWLREFKPSAHQRWMGQEEGESKRAAGLRASNLFYFVVPRGLVAVEEVPDDSGLIYVKPDGSLMFAKQAPFREIGTISRSFVASLARRVLLSANGVNGRNIMTYAGNASAPAPDIEADPPAMLFDTSA